MIYSYRNAFYSMEDNSLIDCEINHSKLGWVPYTLNSSSNSEMWSVVVAGSVAAHSPPSNSVLYASLRGDRSDLLTESDWTQVGDLVSSGAMTADKVTEWKTYRQALRDLPENTSDPSDITWPTRPS